MIKGGIKFSWLDYDFNKLFYVQPEFTYIDDPTRNLDFTFPGEVRLGLGNPRINASDFQFGAYLQDDWNITPKLQLNLGLRWDYESNMFDNNYATPASAATVLRGLPQTSYFKASDYITDGSDRPPYLGMFQPRVGFSYDFKGDQGTVLFGGYGRYYDRNVFNNTLDERFRLQYSTGTFYFSRDGLPRDGNNTVIWNPAYLNRDALLTLRATAQTGLPELFAVPNRAKPPRTDQFSLGVRQRVGIFQVSATGSYVRGSHGYTTLFASRNADGSCCNNAVPNANGYADALIGYDGIDTRYKALYVTIDKPYTVASGWGINIAYTLSKGEQNGNDLFSLDKPTPKDYGYRPISGDQRHKLVLSGTYDLPLGFQISTITTLGSGQAFFATATDARNGGGVNQVNITALYPPKNCIKGLLGYCEVNLSLERDVHLFNSHTVGLAVDLFNAFNNKNFSGYDSYLYEQYAFDNSLTQNNGTTQYLHPSSLLTLPRRIQFRAFYRF